MSLFARLLSNGMLKSYIKASVCPQQSFKRSSKFLALLCLILTFFYPSLTLAIGFCLRPALIIVSCLSLKSPTPSCSNLPATGLFCLKPKQGGIYLDIEKELASLEKTQSAINTYSLPQQNIKPCVCALLNVRYGVLQYHFSSSPPIFLTALLISSNLIFFL